MISLATKSRAALGKTEQKASQVLKDPRCDMVPEVFIRKLQASFATLADYRAQCDVVLSAVKKASEKNTRLAPLDFSKDTLQKLIKEADDTCSALNKMLTLIPK